jgi:hypothetical protein
MIDLRIFNIFRKPSAQTLAVAELEDAHRSLLVAQSAEAYARSMVAYHQDRIARLTRYVKERRS